MMRPWTFIFVFLILALSGCAGVSEVKKGEPAPNSTVMFRTSSGAYMSKSVVSLREARYKSIVPQQFDFSCGAASLATLLKYVYGIEDAQEAEIAKEMIEKGDQEKIREKGFSLLDMKKYAERKGFQANGYKVKTENLAKLKIPVIVLITTRGYKHFVVLKGMKDERAYFADPAIGNRSVPLQEFVKSWDEVVFVVYKKMENQSTLALDTGLKAPIGNVLGVTELGLRNYIRLPGEF